MARFDPSVLPRAANDVQAIYDWLCERSPQGAVNWLAAFDAMIADLKRNADVYGEAAEARDLDRDLKQTLFKTPKGRTYRAVYLIQADHIYVVRVRGPGQPDLATDEIDLGSASYRLD